MLVLVHVSGRGHDKVYDGSMTAVNTVAVPMNGAVVSAEALFWVMIVRANTLLPIVSCSDAFCIVKNPMDNPARAMDADGHGAFDISGAARAAGLDQA